MVVAKIEAIDLDKPWYYTACNFCKRKMVRQGDGFEGNGEAKFLLFNNIAERLIRRPAFELVQEAAQENPHFLPQSLTDLIGKKFLFKITIGTYGQQEHNSAYVVDLVIDDADIIQHFDPHPHFVIFNDYESEED
ncbi:unnamed protein product [Brassica napus]|uniref:(rape) hypothetical protein n=1 Tax=Brassica napus TaxID=3708 RepID=A0A816XXA0_BRANA|nr:unnamed protein product [Brassica napus]